MRATTGITVHSAPHHLGSIGNGENIAALIISDVSVTCCDKFGVELLGGS